MTNFRNERILEAVRNLDAALKEEASVLGHRPLADRVLILVLREDGERKSKGGLYLPQGGKEQNYGKALVVAVGPGPRSHKTGDVLPLNVTEGDVVIVGDRVGQPIIDQDVEYRLVKAADILAIVYEEDAA